MSDLSSLAPEVRAALELLYEQCGWAHEKIDVVRDELLRLQARAEKAEARRDRRAAKEKRGPSSRGST